MKYIFIFSTMLAFFGICHAEELGNTPLSKPNLELVLSIHEFCLSQYNVQQDNNLNEKNEQIENDILHCINEELEMSSYQTFSSYQAMTLFIEPKEGE